MIYFSDNQNFTLIQGDSIQQLPLLQAQSIDMIFADPPYFLSNNGLTVKNGKIVSVNKGQWDQSKGLSHDLQFNYDWINHSYHLLKDHGTIWISSTHHNLFQLGFILNQIGFKILNIITWEKPNPPPNFSCRYFTYSAEWIIWARKMPKTPHYFNYDLMKKTNGDKQMKDIWKLPAVSKWEKTQGKHPTQKPLGLLSRIILSSTQENDLILDPFSGSATTGISAILHNRRYIGIEQDTNFLELSKNRFLELSDELVKNYMIYQINQQIIRQ